MKTVKARLRDQLEVNGWDVLEHVNDLDWWADEIWELRSRWSPVGAYGYITFLVDLMWEGNRRKGQGVWAIGCSANNPKDHAEAQDDGFLRLKGSQEEFQAFLKAVNGFRTWDRNWERI